MTPYYAILLSLAAGFSTAIGGLVAFMIKKPSPRFLAVSLGFSAGVMIFVSFVELLQTGIIAIGFAAACLAFFSGMLIMFVIDFMVPHEYIAERIEGNGSNKKLAKTGLLIALGIAIHNLPEGLAVFAATVHSLPLGIALAVAIAVHNIPEGISVAIPIYAATHDRFKAFSWSFWSGMVEPLGAIIAVLFLMPFLNQTITGAMLAVVAGIMVFISIDELLPVAHSYGEEHQSILGFVSGMIVMALSLWLAGQI
ncbi:MAG: zinc transporter ZupT [Candidatus Margulisbacteria bacterium]|nr:zinc transporter ZupT [Candidatus Margulisiibacteriota bacterium]